MDPRRDTRWWGWGDPEESGSLNEASEAMLNEREILPESAPVLPALGDVKVPPAQPLPDSIADLVGGTNVFTDDEDRIRHSGGQSYLDLLERRSGVIDAAPDAVVLPADAGQIGPLLDICAGAGIAVVPFGGGTSVVGGIAPIRGDHDLVISLDLVNLRACDIDPVSRTARLGAGLRGPEAEKLLGAEGFTLGHFPQSFEYATIGGFAATRSAGQSSSGYGRFDSMVSSVRLIAPAAELSTLDTPHTAIGPALREMVIGSEGIFGVIPDVDVRIRPAPAMRRYEAWIAEDSRSGNEIMRDLAQAGLLPTIARVSDDAETRVSLASAVPSGVAGSAFKGYLGLRGRSGGSLVIVGIEGTSDHVRCTRPELARRLRKGGAVYLGQGAGNGWSKGRFHGPYLRETLLDRGVLVETFETAEASGNQNFKVLLDFSLGRRTGTAATPGSGSSAQCSASEANGALKSPCGALAQPASNPRPRSRDSGRFRSRATLPSSPPPVGMSPPPPKPSAARPPSRTPLAPSAKSLPSVARISA